MVIYRVIKNRKSDREISIKVSIGEAVRCIEESETNSDWAGWTLCSTSKNKGWIPTKIIEVSGENGIIKENYDAVEFDIVIGEIIESTKELNGWVWGRKENSSAEAWVPLKHLEIVK